MEELNTKGKNAKEAANYLMKVSSDRKKDVLLHSAELLMKHKEEIIIANKKIIE